MGESSGTRMSGSSPKSTSIPGKFISFFGNSGDGKSKGAEATKEDCDAGREKLQGDYYTPVLTDVVAKDSNPKAGAERNDLYSPGAGAGIVASDQPGDQQSSWQTKPPSSTGPSSTLLLNINFTYDSSFAILSFNQCSFYNCEIELEFQRSTV